MFRQPVAIVGETHESAAAVCSSQLNYLNIARMKHASTLCHEQMHEQIYVWVFCEVFVVRNFNFLIVWIVCLLIHSFRLLMRLHLQCGILRHCHLHRLCASVLRLCICVCCVCIRSFDIRQPQEVDRLHADKQHTGDFTVPRVYPSRRAFAPRHNNHLVYRPRDRPCARNLSGIRASWERYHEESTSWPTPW